MSKMKYNEKLINHLVHRFRHCGNKKKHFLKELESEIKEYKSKQPMRFWELFEIFNVDHN